MTNHRKLCQMFLTVMFIGLHLFASSRCNDHSKRSTKDDQSSGIVGWQKATSIGIVKKIISAIWNYIQTPVKGEGNIYSRKYTLHDWKGEQVSTLVSFNALNEVVDRCSQDEFKLVQSDLNTCLQGYKKLAMTFRYFKECCDTGKLIRCSSMKMIFSTQEAFNREFDNEIYRWQSLRKRIQDDTKAFKYICTSASHVTTNGTERYTTGKMFIKKHRDLRAGEVMRKCFDYRKVKSGGKNRGLRWQVPLGGVAITGLLSLIGYIVKKKYRKDGEKQNIITPPKKQEFVFNNCDVTVINCPYNRDYLQIDKVPRIENVPESGKGCILM